MIRPAYCLFVSRSLLTVLWLACCGNGIAADRGLAENEHPLKPIDTTSPRATLQGILDATNKGFEIGYGQVQA